jgi:hypothetical protein
VVNGQLEDSLRHEIESYIEGRLSSIKKEISELQSQLNDSLTRLLDRQGDVQMDGSLAASILEHLRAAHEKGVDLAASESSRAKASSDMAIVKAAIEEIHQQQSQGEILKTLVNRAASFAPRVAFFVIKGEQASGWRGRGFEGTVGDKSIQEINLNLSADTVVGSVARSKTTWSGGPGSHQEDHVLLNQLGDEPPQRIVAVPLTVRGRSVAVLYADSAGLDSEAINLEALETLVHVSGMSVELVSVSRTPKTGAEAVHREESPEATTSYTPTREYEVQTPVAPVSEAQPPAATLQPEPSVEQEPLQKPSKRAQPPRDVPPPPPIASEPAPPSTGRRRYGMDAADLPVSVGSEEERRLHNDARRFARLLVSEIKLYNEQKVIEGRSHSDLYERLKEYIDRSREMYDKRVKPDVALRFDYFHNELVQTLAEGHSEKLGASYPGATVNA